MRAPLVRRTRTPRGPTPELDQGGGHRPKVAVAAALGLSPRRDRRGLDFPTLLHGSFDSGYGAAFRAAMVREWDGRCVLVGDGGPMHRGDPIRPLASPFRDRLIVEDLPPWTPMRCPVEPLGGWLKDDQGCKFAPHDAIELQSRIIADNSATTRPSSSIAS